MKKTLSQKIRRLGCALIMLAATGCAAAVESSPHELEVRELPPQLNERFWNRFDAAERSPIHEERFVTHLEASVGTQWRASYELECHDVLCRLRPTSNATADAFSLVRARLNQALHSAAMVRATLVQSRPELVALYELESVSTAATRLLVAETLRESRSLAECRREFVAHADVRVMIKLDSPRRLTLTSLDDTPAARCVRSALGAVLAAVVIPVDAKDMQDQSLVIRFDAR